METINIYTDGACSGNPGPAGIGIVLRYKEHCKRVSEYIGEGTNNVAELTAILRSLQMVKNPKFPVVIYTDSNYCLGILAKGWKAKQNVILVDDIRELMGKFESLEIIKVSGHTGMKDNELADSLARMAITNKKNEIK